MHVEIVPYNVGFAFQAIPIIALYAPQIISILTTAVAALVHQGDILT